MPLITLTSDYGHTDHYAASVKGALYSELPNLQICDISHQIEPGNLMEASFVLRNSYKSFPRGTVHLVLVKEMSKSQRWLVAELEGHFFVLADNGLVSMINPELKLSRIIEININQEESLFPGRDFLARVAAHLARGGKPDVLGRSVSDFEEKKMYRHIAPQDKNSLLGSVVYVDNFGNLITNISRKIFKEVGKERPFEIVLPRNQKLSKLNLSYDETTDGKIIALFNSQDLLEIALVNPRGKQFNGANTLLGLDVRDSVTIYFT